MNPILLHYANGSATADWLRMARAIEAAEDFAPLGTGPLAPERAPLPRPYAALAAILVELRGGIEAAQWLARYAEGRS